VPITVEQIIVNLFLDTQTTNDLERSAVATNNNKDKEREEGMEKGRGKNFGKKEQMNQ